MQLGKMKYLSLLLEIELADVFKTANLGAPLILLGADWLNTPERK